MDHGWINSSRISHEYKKGVEEFLKFAKRIFLIVMEAFTVLVLNV